MGQIQILDEHMTNLIAAGEVIERPKSVVKELVENAIDAHASVIKIQLENAGLSEIRVIDNGIGMDREDANMCFIPHATSKIKTQDDLFNIKTLGFRGEALASIVAVSSFNLKTSTDGYHGIMLSLKGGVPLSEATISHPRGTEVTVRNLFFNTPARLAHMKPVNVELAYITDFVSKIAIAHKEISFILTNNSKELLHTSGNNNVLEVISEVYSTQVAREMLEIFDNNGVFKISGYISKISITKSSKNNIIIYLNGRVVYNKGIVNAIMQGYGNLLMPSKYPICIINIDVDLGLVDVNVHPTKYEVRLSDEATLKEMLENIVRKTLSSVDLSVSADIRDIDVGISNFIEDENEETNENIEERIRMNDAYNNEVHEEVEEEVEEDKVIDAQTAISNLEKIEDLNIDFDNIEEQEPSYNQEDINSLENWDDFNNNLENNEEFNDLDDIEYEDEEIDYVKEDEYLDNEEDEETEEEVRKPIQEELPFLNEDNLIHDNDSSRIQKMYYIGQLFGTYILAQNEDTFYLIDQHAANERVNFEKIMKEFSKETVASYDLLVPINLEYSKSEAILIKEKMDEIRKFGIEIEEFGESNFVVRSIPIWFFRGKEQEFSEEIINHIIHNPNENDYRKQDFLKDIAATMACKRSIKGNEYHSSLEIEYLLEELAKCENPFTCPHGRPVIVKISKNDVEKWFKRIVS